jgi:hypothetical protein
VAVAMLEEVPNMKRILRRLILSVDIAKTFAPCDALYKCVKLCGYDI